MSKLKHLNKAKPAGKNLQYAALPVRASADGGLEVMLVTSRETKRWIIPKGWPMRKLTPGATAAREAYEEAGIEGIIRPNKAVGSYSYAKSLETGELPVTVKVFLLHVERQRERWPEQPERETRWFSPEAAAELVAEPELAAILRSAAELVAQANAGSGGSSSVLAGMPG
jgi:8-oxo-dGTP pyrophosphatase MutT (NUDIX family)